MSLNSPFFCKLMAFIAMLLSFYFITKGLNIDLDETKYNQIALNHYYRIRIMHFSIAFVLMLKLIIILAIRNIALQKILAFSLLVDVTCLFFAERATSYLATGFFMNPTIANIIIGVPLLIIFFNQIYYIYLLVIKRKKMHWEIGLEKILDTNN